MEVCDLDECDFVETRFKEYDSEADYLADTLPHDDRLGYSATANGNEKGIILWFQTAPALTQDGYVSPPIQLYEYAPIGATPAEYEQWEEAVFAKHESRGNIWVRTIHWYLDEYSCVLVRRNRLWFSEAVKVLQRVWAMIVEERQAGYEHRAPVKRKAGVATVAAAGGGGGPGSIDSFFKIVKLDTAILPTADTATATATATNMATLMAQTHQNHQTHHHKSNTRGGPSDTLIKCFKIDDLEMDESK
jgi:hypothetical protein